MPLPDRALIVDDTVYDYVLQHSLREHPAQVGLRGATRDNPRAYMQVSPEHGQLLAMLARLVGARRTIEVGVFTGYSALSVALALPADGYMLALDVNEEFTSVGRPYWAQAAVDSRIHLVIGPALQTLDARLASGEAGSYDLAFIDADKPRHEAYYERCLQLVRPGGVIVLDNVLWYGRVARPAERDEYAKHLHALNCKVHADDRVDLVMLPIGDGVTIARKR